MCRSDRRVWLYKRSFILSLGGTRNEKLFRIRN
nr:MAG TPA: hypothetical protein [Caudoviricetes sp.]